MKITKKDTVRIDDNHNKFKIIDERQTKGMAPAIGVYEYTEYLLSDGATEFWVPEMFLERYEMQYREPEAYEAGRDSVLKQLKTFLEMNVNIYK